MLKEFRTLGSMVRRYRWWYVAGVLSLILTSGGQLLIPLLVGQAIDRLVDGLGPPAIVTPMIIMLGAAVFIAIGRVGWRFFIHGASRRIEMELRERLYNHLVTLPESWFQANKTGDIMARATNDMNAIRMAVGMALVAAVDGLFMTVAILAILLAQNPRLALLTVMPLPLITFTILTVGKRVGPLFRTVQEGFSRLSDQTQEVLSGVRVVKAFVKEDFFRRRFGDANDAYQEQNMRLVRLWGMFLPIVTFFSGLTLLMLLWFGGRSLIAGDITAGMFVSTLSYLQMLTWPMMGAGFTINLLQRGAASLRRINEILSTRSDIESPPEARTRTPQPAIAVRGLTYRFTEDADPALADIDLAVDPGETLGIIGRTGSGKSTLVSLLPRIVDPPPATVFVDGTDIREFDLDVLRGAFAVVPQGAFLFSATIGDNIRFGKPEASDADVTAAAEAAAFADELGAFPEGYRTVVGERGVTLSGGQRQRAALARALLVNAPILVLDDSLSAVDTRTEERILSSLRRLREGRTTVIVSNRVSAIQHADQIIVLEHGRIVDRGRHEQLIMRDGLYREIYDLQQLERTGDPA